MSYIKITLLSDLCAGSGESEGNTIDTDICTDAFGIPYIPARRIKGCLRQAAEELRAMGHKLASKENIVRLFGDAEGTESAFTVGNAYISGIDSLTSYLRKKENPDLPESAKKIKNAANITKLFTSVRGQTSLKDGVKVENTLRFTRVLNHYDPLALGTSKEMELYAKLYLETADEDMKELLKLCCSATRHMGNNRNRGLGNVNLTVDWETQGEGKSEEGLNTDGLGEKVRITYQVALDAPLTLVGCGELNTMIAARTVIGCMASHYLKSGKAEDETFKNLFLNGTVKWSGLTPIIDGVVSAASPLILMKLKNGGGRLINRLAEQGEEWKKQKPKTLDGNYAAVVTSNGTEEYHIASVKIHSIYHNSVTRKQLYMQDYIEAGLLYGGTVEMPLNLASVVYKMLQEANLQFGRSKRAQYAACSLYGTPKCETISDSKIKIPAGEAIIVILKSDMIYDNGCYCVDNASVRTWIAKELGVRNERPEGYEDYCLYHTVGGFQTQWKLQKPHVPAVRGGSVYCFVSDGTEVPETITIGEYQQEGIGICEVYSLEKIKKIHKVEKSEIAAAAVEKKEDVVKHFRSLLLVHAATEAVKAYARIFKIDHQLPVGRLRLMLQEATNLVDLRNRINTMRCSDESIYIEEGKKALSLKLLDKLYGNDALEQIERLGGEDETELFQAVREDEDALAVMEKNWKLALQIVLHRAHYSKGKK